MAHSSTKRTDYGVNIETCDDNVYKVLDRKQRIDFVQSFLLKKKQVAPRENVVVFGVPGALSELVGATIGEEPGVFYLPKALQSRAYYINHDPTLAIPITIEFFEKILNCDFDDELFLEHLLRNKTLPFTAKLPSCVFSRDEISKNISYNACREELSDWLSENCRQNKLTVLQTDKLKSITYLQVLTTEIKSRKFNIRVMYIVRDPRAIIYDFFKSSQLNTEKVQILADRICTRIRMDLQYARSSPIWHPGRYKLIKIEEFVRNSSVLGAVGSNYTIQSDWKWKIPSKIKQIVDDQCSKVLNMLGYSVGVS